MILCKTSFERGFAHGSLQTPTLVSNSDDDSRTMFDFVGRRFNISVFRLKLNIRAENLKGLLLFVKYRF